jgi:hypothetical protein
MAQKVKAGSADELDEMFPEAKPIRVRLKKLTGEGRDQKVEWETATAVVEPLSVVELARLAKLLRPILKDVAAAANIMALAADHPDTIIEAIAIAVHWPITDAERMDPSSFMKVGIAAFEANADFFTRRLGLLASGPLATMKDQLGAGQIPSDSSSATGTSTQSDIH